MEKLCRVHYMLWVEYQKNLTFGKTSGRVYLTNGKTSSFLLHLFMLVYNVTVFVEESIATDWLEWMKSVHIPEVMAVGLFKSYRMLEVLDSPNEGLTYCMQYEVENKADYDRYQTEFAPNLQAQSVAKFGEKAIAFRTLMQVC